MKFSRFSSAASGLAGHQLQRSFLQGFAYASFPVAPFFRGARRRARSGLRQTSTFGCSREIECRGLFSMASTWNFSAADCSRGQTRCAAVSRSVGDTENFAELSLGLNVSQGLTALIPHLLNLGAPVSPLSALGQTRRAAVSRSVGDAENFAGLKHSSRSLTFLSSSSLLKSLTAPTCQGVALISLKALLNGQNNYLANWNESDADPCRWARVRCQPQSGRVHMLQLQGPISPEIGKLDHLRRRNLHSNRLFGSIPKELGNRTSLRQLYLLGNFLTRNIPTELGKLRHLVVLDLASNGLTGNIPSSIGSLFKLTFLNISSNLNPGEIPANGIFKNFTSQSECSPLRYSSE